MTPETTLYLLTGGGAVVAFFLKRTLDRIEADLKALMVASSLETIAIAKLEVRITVLENSTHKAATHGP